MRVKEKFNKKLLVEGNDDQHVVWSLCEKFTVPENFDVIDCEGIEKLISQIPLRFKQSDIQTIGIIVDADSNIANRWESLKSTLTLQGFVMPNELPNDGLIIVNQINQKLGIWIMPNNKTDGMLEDFISFLVPKEDKLLVKAIQTLDDIEANTLNKYSIIHKSKALIHTWLAWQEDPGTPMGLGITKKYLTTDETNCLRFITWIENLYR